MRVIEKLRVYSLYDFMIKTVSQYNFFVGQRKSTVNNDKTVSKILVYLVNNFETDK